MQPLWKIVWQFSPKREIELSYDPEIPFLGIYPKELKLKLKYLGDIGIPILIAVLSKHPRSGSNSSVH